MRYRLGRAVRVLLQRAGMLLLQLHRRLLLLLQLLALTWRHSEREVARPSRLDEARRRLGHESLRCCPVVGLLQAWIAAGENISWGHGAVGWE